MKNRKNHRINPGHYEYHIDGHVYSVIRVVHGRIAGRDDFSWEAKLNGKLISTFDLMADAFEYIEGLHKEARQEHFGYRMLPE